jgi:AcrR family transcriptional regulator
MAGARGGETRGRAAQSLERRDATRRALLRAAQQCFVERGYLASAVSDIVRAAGVSQGTFYLYFPSKLAIMLALMDIGSERLQETARRLIAEQPDARQVIGGFIAETAQFFRTNQALLLVLFREVEQQEVSIARQRQNSVLCEILAPALARGSAAGYFRPEEPKLLARMLLETAFVLFYRFLLAPEDEAPPRVEERIVAFCLGAISARE